MTKEKDENEGYKERNQPISETTKQKVYFNIGLEQLDYLADAFQNKFGKKLDKSKVKTLEIKELIFHNKLWDIKEMRTSTPMGKKKKALLQSLSDEEVEALLKKKGVVVE
jgi:hypothetical protein